MDALIDPTTRGYVLLDGTPQRDPADGLANACYLRLTVRLGSYWADRTLGSELYKLQREKDVQRVAAQAKQYAEHALSPLLGDGRAKTITVTTERPGNGRLHLLIDVLAANGQRYGFNHPVQVGA